MTLGETIAVGLLTSFAAALLTWLGHFLVALLQSGNERSRLVREKLLDRYSELMAVAADDLERARTQGAVIMTSGREGDFTAVAPLDAKRHATRVQFLRLTFQIRLLEPDALLAEQVQALGLAQPFMVAPFPPRWGEGNYDQRVDDFQRQIGDFERQMTALADGVLVKYSAYPGKGIAASLNGLARRATEAAKRRMDAAGGPTAERK